MTLLHLNYNLCPWVWTSLCSVTAGRFGAVGDSVDCLAYPSFANCPCRVFFTAGGNLPRSRAAPPSARKPKATGNHRPSKETIDEQVPSGPRCPAAGTDHLAACRRRLRSGPRDPRTRARQAVPAAPHRHRTEPGLPHDDQCRRREDPRLFHRPRRGHGGVVDPHRCFPMGRQDRDPHHRQAGGNRRRFRADRNLKHAAQPASALRRDDATAVAIQPAARLEQ